MTSPKDSISSPSAMTCENKPNQTPRQGVHPAACLVWEQKAQLPWHLSSGSLSDYAGR